MVQIIYYRFSHHLYMFTSFLFLAFPSTFTAFPPAFTRQPSIPQALPKHACRRLSSQSRELFLLLFSSSGDILGSQPCFHMLFLVLHSVCSDSLPCIPRVQQFSVKEEELFSNRRGPIPQSQGVLGESPLFLHLCFSTGRRHPGMLWIGITHLFCALSRDRRRLWMRGGGIKREVS